MKKYLYITILGLIVALVFSIRQCSNFRRELDIATANIKAYNYKLSDYKGKALAFQFTIDQLEYFRDSIIDKLDSTRKALKIKDKNLQAMHYVASGFSKPDTITLTDTIFKDSQFSMDTILGDKWYTMKMKLEYPSTIAVEPSFKSEKHIVVSTKKETVNPPKKWWILRVFQKKHTVVQVDISEQSPYMINGNSKYIEIIK